MHIYVTKFELRRFNYAYTVDLDVEIVSYTVRELAQSVSLNSKDLRQLNA